MANQDDHPSARLQAAKVKLLEDLLQQRTTHLHLHHKSDPKRNYYKYLLQKPWNPQLLVSKPPHHSFSFLFLFLFLIFQSSQVLTYLLRPPPHISSWAKLAAGYGDPCTARLHKRLCGLCSSIHNHTRHLLGLTRRSYSRDSSCPFLPFPLLSFAPDPGWHGQYDGRLDDHRLPACLPARSPLESLGHASNASEEEVEVEVEDDLDDEGVEWGVLAW